MCLRADYVNRIQQAVEDRVWAIEGCNGIGHHITMRLLAAGQQVVDVPSKLSARARIFATGQGPARPTPPTPAQSPWSAVESRTVAGGR
jgi:transposase